MWSRFRLFIHLPKTGPSGWLYGSLRLASGRRSALRAFRPKDRGRQLGAVFTLANSQRHYFRLSWIMKIARNAIFGSEEGYAQGNPYSR
jgi:hypothetical protein